MKAKLKQICLRIAVVFMIISLCIGYAALSTTLQIVGTASAEGKPYEGVYIKHVEVYSQSNVTSTVNDYIHPTNHSVTVTPNRSGGTITYKITVHNNTDVTYWYISQLINNSYGKNGIVGQTGGITVVTKDHPSDNSSTFNSNDWIPPQTERDFYVTYTYGVNAQTTCQTLINFRFDIRMDAVHDEFLAVLNNTKTPTSYEYLSDAFQDHYDQTGSCTITSNSHPEVFDDLFGHLMVNINGVEREATVAIVRENIDKDATSGDKYDGGSPAGCEYTLYITVDSIEPGGNPTVYAIAYSKGAAGMGSDWYQVGELYEGTAPVQSDGTIDYSKWVATANTYTVADGIYYKVAQQNGDQYDLLKTMEELISTNDQDIFNDIDNTKIFKKVYDILQNHRGSTDPAVEGLRAIFEDCARFYNNFNNGQEFKVVRNVYTRAEIIPAIEALYEALQYYYQAYPET